MKRDQSKYNFDQSILLTRTALKVDLLLKNLCKKFQHSLHKFLRLRGLFHLIWLSIILITPSAFFIRSGLALTFVLTNFLR